MITWSIETFTLEFTYSCSLDTNYITDLLITRLAEITPDSQLNWAIPFIKQSHMLSVFSLTTLKINRFSLADFLYNTGNVNSFSLYNFADLLNLSEIECLLCNGSIIFDDLNLGFFLKNDLEIILNWSISLVGHLDSCIWDPVDFILLEAWFEYISWLVKESSLNLCSIHITKFNLHQLTTISGRSFLALGCYARLNCPVSAEWVQCFYWCIVLLPCRHCHVIFNCWRYFLFRFFHGDLWCRYLWLLISIVINLFHLLVFGFIVLYFGGRLLCGNFKLFHFNASLGLWWLLVSFIDISRCSNLLWEVIMSNI